MTAQETKKTEISIFSENDKAISEIMATSKTLVITDLEDKEQYDKVHNQRMALVKMRTQGIDPKEEELTNPLKGKLKEIKDEAGRLRTIIKNEEARLESEEKKVDEFKEKTRIEKEKKAQEKLQNRLNLLKEVEGTIDIAILQRLTDGEFEEDLSKFKKAFEEKIALELEEKKKREEAEELVKKQQEELKKQQDDILKQQQEIANQQKIIDDQKKAIEDENKRLKEIEEQKIKDEQDKKQQEAQKIIDEENARIKQKEEDEKNEKLAKERAELEEKSRPEREKLLRYVDAIASIPVPEVTVPDNVRMLSNIQNTIEQMKKLVKMLAVDLITEQDTKELKDEEMRAEAQADGELYNRELEESNNQI